MITSEKKQLESIVCYFSFCAPYSFHCSTVSSGPRGDINTISKTQATHFFPYSRNSFTFSVVMFFLYIRLKKQGDSVCASNTFLFILKPLPIPCRLISKSLDLLSMNDFPHCGHIFKNLFCSIPILARSFQIDVLRLLRDCMCWAIFSSCFLQDTHACTHIDFFFKVWITWIEPK